MYVYLYIYNTIFGQIALQLFLVLSWCHLWRLPYWAMISLTIKTEQNALQFVLGLFWCCPWRLPSRAIIGGQPTQNRMLCNFAWGCFGAIFGDYHLGPSFSDQKNRTECSAIFPGGGLVPLWNIYIYMYLCKYVV